MDTSVRALPERPEHPANERLKRQWTGGLRYSVLLAAALHAGVFSLWPQIRIDESLVRGGMPPNLVYLRGTAEVRVPAPPDELRLPALPRVAELELELPHELAAPLPDFTERIPVELPSPPTLRQGDEWASYARFAPSMVRPEIRNRAEVERFLLTHYQPILDATGIHGVVHMQYWIDEAGAVQRMEVVATSGHHVLDRLAVQLSEIVRFRPALHRGDPVRVQVIVPVEFRRIR